MKDSTLFKISIVCSLIGIFILFIVSEKLDLSKSDIGSINKEMLDKKVKVKGYISSIAETPGLYIINLNDETGNITAIVFKEESFNITKGSIIEIEGKVVEYKEKLEINAEIIRI